MAARGLGAWAGRGAGATLLQPLVHLRAEPMISVSSCDAETELSAHQGILRQVFTPGWKGGQCSPGVWTPAQGPR